MNVAGRIARGTELGGDSSAATADGQCTPVLNLHPHRLLYGQPNSRDWVRPAGHVKTSADPRAGIAGNHDRDLLADGVASQPVPPRRGRLLLSRHQGVAAGFACAGQSG
jgi:hypothetical protein